MAWLSIIADKNLNTKQGEIIGVHEIVEEFWQTFGRNYYSRYDYENVTTDSANKVMAHLLTQFNHFNVTKQSASQMRNLLKSPRIFK